VCILPFRFYLCSHCASRLTFSFHHSRYFGRAKDLPGVKELFQSRKNEEEEETQALSFYKKFMNQGPGYYGDLDEADGRLLEFERTVEEEGM
jgi:pre-mRNA-splicing factor ISY1